MKVDLPSPRPFRGRAMWFDVVGNLALAMLGAGLVWFVLVAVPADVVALRVLAIYTAAASSVTLGLALMTAVTRRLPVLQEVQLDGSRAFVVRAWPGEWWHALLLDVGLVVLAAVLVGLGLAAGGWLLGSAVVAVVGLWFLIRVLLTITGRRRREAVWLTDAELVHDAPWGRERVQRSQVMRVRAAGEHLVLEVDGPVHRTLCPRPWRRARPAAGRVVISCSGMGHTAEALGEWLRNAAASDQIRDARR